jgi:ADP-heptose:LPS heptosyltransferase
MPKGDQASDPAIVNKRRRMQFGWSRLAYLWFYILRRGPRALQRRFQILKDRRRVLKDAHVDGGFLVAVQIAGGIGDQIIIARFLRDLASEFPDMYFDIFSNDLTTTKWAFGGNRSFRGTYIDSLFSSAHMSYDYSIEISDTVTPVSNRLGSSKGGEIFAALLRRAVIYNEANDDVFSLGSSGRTLQAIRLVCDNAARHTALQHIAGITYGGDEMPLATDPTICRANGIEGRTYVTLHTGFGTDQVTVGRRSTKCYPHFDSVIELMRAKHPEFVFVQLGARNSEPLKQADIRLLGSTSMPQVGALLAGAALHMDNESGLVHIARCFGTRSCVVFGPTNPDYFGYEANVAMRPPVCGGCWWVTKDWMNSCPRGFAAPICTEWIPPEAVSNAALLLIKEANAR